MFPKNILRASFGIGQPQNLLGLTPVLGDKQRKSQVGRPLNGTAVINGETFLSWKNGALKNDRIPVCAISTLFTA